MVQGGGRARIAGSSSWFAGRTSIQTFLLARGMEDLRDTRGPWRESELTVRHDIRASDLFDTLCLIFSLPVRPYLIKPGMVQVEERISRA